MQKSRAKHYHDLILDGNSLYEETAHWFPVYVTRPDDYLAAVDWFEERDVTRGNKEARNDWLHPIGRLFIFRERWLAIQFALRFQDDRLLPRFDPR